MNITAAMSATLAVLTEALDDPGVDITHSLQRLALAAAEAFPTYIGLSVVVPQSNPPIIITTMTAGTAVGDVRTSLHISVPDHPADPRTTLATAIILYARSPGTFVDLAADLTWLTGRPAADFVLDQDLTVPAAADISADLHAASDIDQAIGVLIGRGETPQHAHHLLDRHAADNRTDRRTAAQLILDTITATGDDPHHRIRRVHGPTEPTPPTHDHRNP
ncbi:ANTAR domain-containing protein [Rhodococcus sp. AQ5-07]|uniref:ANTAR domain-containing protein n=1 Tax=Rhodococcus sp. AQ5-07 TaxID=2054902 RepID=UPI000DBF8060|nr:ANTAR domain-containing protein [Rhodococcus sp. AQ5-07]RAL30831.1 hypothetical protein CVN56_31335 [Rhodococcus sp. AQ5-07]